MSVKVLFVCLGNICRSPTAEGVFRHSVARAGLAEQVRVDSAGTAHWHIGRAPDARSVAAAARRGYDLSALRARQISPTDFEIFDYVLAMDEANLRHLRMMAPSDYQGQLGLLLDYSNRYHSREVPDPYHGEGSGFELVLDMLEEVSQGLLQDIRNRLSLGQALCR